MRGADDWKLGQINGEWNGIVHIPTWTFFKIVDGTAKFIGTRDIDPPSEEEIQQLAEQAAKWFEIGELSRDPLGRPIKWCDHPRGLRM